MQYAYRIVCEQHPWQLNKNVASCSNNLTDLSLSNSAHNWLDFLFLFSGLSSTFYYEYLLALFLDKNNVGFVIMNNSWNYQILNQFAQLILLHPRNTVIYVLRGIIQFQKFILREDFKDKRPYIFAKRVPKFRCAEEDISI